MDNMGSWSFNKKPYSWKRAGLNVPHEPSTIQFIIRELYICYDNFTYVNLIYCGDIRQVIYSARV